MQRYGNTFAASIPLALNEAVQQNRVQPGQTLCLVGFGAGLTAASAIVQWQ
jgi:3-oxoacyl-[acyl-carrier-protein] synthase-3